MNAAIKAYKAQTAKACKAQKAQATIVTKLAHSHETQIALLSSQNAQIEPLNSHKQQAKPLNSHNSQGKQETKPLNSRETLNSHNAQTKPSTSTEFTGFSSPQIEPNILPYAFQIEQNSNQAQTLQAKQNLGNAKITDKENLNTQAQTINKANQSPNNAQSQAQMIGKTAQNLNKISNQAQAVQTLGKTNLNNLNNPNKAPSKRQDILYHNDFNAEIFFPTNFNKLDFNIFYTIFYLALFQKSIEI